MRGKDAEAPTLDDLQGFAEPVDLPRSYAWVGWTIGCGIVILAGFQGRTPQGRITTLGRGGSDLSAIAMAAAG